jgi:phage-related minor tail protein
MSRRDDQDYDDRAHEDYRDDSVGELEAWLEQQPAEAENAEAYDEEYEGEYTDGEYAEGDAEYDEPADEAPARGSRRRRDRRRADAAAAGGGSAVTLGALVAMGGVGWAFAGAFVPGVADASMPLQAVGLSPFGVSLLGIVLAAFGAVRRGATPAVDAGAQQETTQTLLDAIEDLRVQIADRSQGAAPEGAEGISQDLARVQMVLQRQDEKINNLTRATKMYGQPLVEITTQVGDLVEQQRDAGKAAAQLQGEVKQLAMLVQQTREPLESLTQLDLAGSIRGALGQTAQAIEAAMAEVRDALQKTITTKLAELAPTVQGVAEQVRPLATGLERVGARFEKLEAMLDAAPQRTTSMVGTDVSQALQKVSGSMQQELEKSTQKMQDALRALGEQVTATLSTVGSGSESAPVDLGGIETVLDQLRRDVAGVSTSMSRLAANAQRQAQAPAPAAAPAATVSAPQAAVPAQAAAPAAPAAADAPQADGSGKPGPGGLAHSIAGSRPAGGKNVLGAIAKLKQMRN